MSGILLRWLAPPDAGPEIIACGSLADFRIECINRRKAIEWRRTFERALSHAAQSGGVEGNCDACGKTVKFALDWAGAYPVNGVLQPNWRETLVCPQCGLNNRMRASVRILERICRPDPAKSVLYLTEQKTGYFSMLKTRIQNLTGSEFLSDGTSPGATNRDGVRHEDMTALSFANDSLDMILSFDVMEHIPDYLAAWRECWRCLRPGGMLFFSAPFDPNADRHLVRAERLPDGTIRHILPPEYHGDPLNSQGCLSYRVFGWQAVDELAAAGFVETRGLLCWSREHAHLGGNIFFVLARKPAR